MIFGRQNFWGRQLGLSIANAAAAPLQGMQPLHYQWHKDGRKLGGAGSDSPRLVLVEISSADAGYYTCTVTNQGGLRPKIWACKPKVSCRSSKPSPSI